MSSTQIKINLKFLGHYDKALNSWSQLVVGNSKKILLGVKKNHVLSGIETLSLSDFEKITNLSQLDKNVAFDFLNRLLQFVVTNTKKVKSEKLQFKALQFRCFYPRKQFIEKEDTEGWRQFFREKCLRAVECVEVQSEPEWFSEQKHIFAQQK